MLVEVDGFGAAVGELYGDLLAVFGYFYRFYRTQLLVGERAVALLPQVQGDEYVAVADIGFSHGHRTY